MKLKWLGHAAFSITSADGTKIITDPYAPGGPLTYAPIDEPADIVTVSHGHGDHGNVAAVGGNPQIVKGPVSATVKDVAIQGVATFHDTVEGAQRGRNTIFCITVDGMRIAHLGDLGHVPSKEQFLEMGAVDILLTPVGGTYAIDAATALRITRTLKPRVVVPMHFKNAKCTYPITDAEPFLEGCPSVSRLDGSAVELTKERLPAPTQAIVLRPAL